MALWGWYSTTPRPVLNRSFGGGKIAAPDHMSTRSGVVEYQPHNAIHGAIGGLMQAFPTAALDPIFYLHHANIDRLWSVWAGVFSPEYEDSGAWLNQAFVFFDSGGQPIQMQVASVLDTEFLGYVYDAPTAAAEAAAAEAAVLQVSTVTQALADTPPKPPTIQAASSVGIDLTPAPLTVPLADVAPAVSVAPQGTDPGTAAAQSVVLVLGGLWAVAPPGCLFMVFLNQPADQAPDPDGIYFAGLLPYFGNVLAGSEGAHGDHDAGGELSLDVTALVAAQQAAGTWRGDTPVVTFVPVTGTGEPATVAAGSRPTVEVIYLYTA